jgi:hypothetical protein
LQDKLRGVLVKSDGVNLPREENFAIKQEPILGMTFALRVLSKKKKRKKIIETVLERCQKYTNGGMGSILANISRYLSLFGEVVSRSLRRAVESCP